MNEYRHVCFKDLENYFKRTDLFSGLTKPELNKIKENLNLASMDDLNKVVGGIVKKSYDELKQLTDNNQLTEACRYILTDFQTIYKSNSGEIWGLEINPSKTYWLVLTPVSKNRFNKLVSIVDSETEEALDWLVYYDFTQETLSGSNGTFKTKGKITYLKDSNNNSAYYDFKNIRFKHALKQGEGNVPFDTTLDLYTFTELQTSINGAKVLENSDKASNNQFDQNCYDNVFLKEAKNNHFYGGCMGNLFLEDCNYNKFEWNTKNNKFKDDITYTQGTVQNAIFESSFYNSTVGKQLVMLHNSNNAEPMFIVTTWDGDTLTQQVTLLQNNI